MSFPLISHFPFLFYKRTPFPTFSFPFQTRIHFFLMSFIIVGLTSTILKFLSFERSRSFWEISKALTPSIVDSSLKRSHRRSPEDTWSFGTGSYSGTKYFSLPRTEVPFSPYFFFQNRYKCAVLECRILVTYDLVFP